MVLLFILGSNLGGVGPERGHTATFASGIQPMWQGGEKDNSELKTLIRAEVGQQECFEAMGYQSLTWRLLQALQSLFSAVQLQGELLVTIPPFFPIAGRVATRFWRKKQGSDNLLVGESGRGWQRRMRKGDSHAQRLGSVESIVTNERGWHAKRVQVRGESHLLRKSEV
jgi:hypothetical protein